MNDRIRELAAEILRLRGEPASDDEHFAFAFVRHLFLAEMKRAETAEAALAEAVAKERERCAKVCEEMADSRRSALADAEHMTIAWYDPTNHHVSANKEDPLFTPLGQLWSLDVERKWVGLTDEEKAYSNTNYLGKSAEAWHGGVEWAETKLKERNK